MGAAPTGKKAVAALKRKPSTDDVLMRKGKKVKGGPVVAHRYMRRSFFVAKS